MGQRPRPSTSYLRDKRMKGIEIIHRNQYTPRDLPTLPYVPGIIVTGKSKYQMARPE